MRFLALAIGLGLLGAAAGAGAQSFDHVRFEWTRLAEVNDKATYVDQRHIQRGNPFTYVALRTQDDSRANAAYLVRVVALDCKKKTVTTASTGMVSADGKQREWGVVNSDAILKKYNARVPTAYAALNSAFRAGCERTRK